MATLDSLHVYPLKSARGIDLDRATLAATGLAGDRRWMLVSAAGRFLTQREHPQLLVAHRYITRPFNAGNENHIALSEHEFFTRAEQHLFALSWHANNNYYGIGIEIDLWLHAGFDVVANGSRAHLPQAQARYADALLPICLQVSPAVLRQRRKQAHQQPLQRQRPCPLPHAGRAVRHG